MLGDTWQAMCHHACKLENEWEFVEEGRSRKEEKEKKERERKRKKREREGEERKRERGRKGSWRSDGRNSSDQEVKVVYSTRATLQEVGILPTLVYFHPKGLFVKYGNVACFDPTHWLDVSTGFRLGNRGNLDSSPHINCSCICKLDVRLLNYPNWTCTAQVMVHFPRLPQLRLSLNLGPDFGTVLCPGSGMFVWPMMAVCVDCFVGISYATIGLENQVGFACF